MSPSTIRDVARLAQVSTATVSRVFSGSNPVREQTIQRVRSAARTLDYRPNRAARDLVTGDRRTLGLLVADLDDPRCRGVAKGALRRARDEGVLMALAEVAGSGEDEQDIATALAGRTDGVVLCAPELEPAFAERLAEQVPIVTTDRRLGRLPAVLHDERARRTGGAPGASPEDLGSAAVELLLLVRQSGTHAALRTIRL